MDKVHVKFFALIVEVKNMYNRNFEFHAVLCKNAHFLFISPFDPLKLFEIFISLLFLCVA